MKSHGSLSAEPSDSAVLAGLRYVDPKGPGIRRIRCGHGFRYLNATGTVIRHQRDLQRIRALVIPPAWRDVWICPSPAGHLQAVGWDAKGRKQYRYHSAYREARDSDKFGRMIAFGTVLAVIRRRVARDLRRSGLPREKILATLVRLLETTCIRVGNVEYEKANASFGLTTLRNRHVRIQGGTVKFQFNGKSGQQHCIELADRTIARVLRDCQELPGYKLFQYVDEAGAHCTVDSGDVNNYLREITGQGFTAKDFRTWVGTVLAARELASMERSRSAAQAKRNIAGAVKEVSKQLGNRPAACRKYYIHPAIFEAYEDGSLFDVMRQGMEQQKTYNGKGLSPEEYSVMVLIAEYLKNRETPKREAA